MKYYYDLHIHSALSPCGDDDMTPNNIVNMAMLNELNIIALSDHNTCKNVMATKKAAENAGLIFIAGMELETAEEIHVLCLFSDVESALSFDREVVEPALADIKNNEKIFGRQVILDEFDDEVGTDDRYLINATSIPIDSVDDIIKNYNGVAIPAHIDKQTKSLISVLGMADESMGFKTFELSKNAPDDYADTQFSLKGRNYNYIHDSDAHYLYDIAEKGKNNYFEFDSPPTAKDIVKILLSSK